MMHSLLLSNVDVLSLSSNPAGLLPTPASLGGNTQLQKLALCWFMALMAEVSCSDLN
jgi:hypothetical protein